MIQQSHSQVSIWRKPYFEKIHAPQCSEALLKIAKTWKQLKCPLKEEWTIDRSCGTYTEWNITQPQKRMK